MRELGRKDSANRLVAIFHYPVAPCDVEAIAAESRRVRQQLVERDPSLVSWHVGEIPAERIARSKAVVLLERQHGGRDELLDDGRDVEQRRRIVRYRARRVAPADSSVQQDGIAGRDEQHTRDALSFGPPGVFGQRTPCGVHGEPCGRLGWKIERVQRTRERQRHERAGNVSAGHAPTFARMRSRFLNDPNLASRGGVPLPQAAPVSMRDTRRNRAGGMPTSRRNTRVKCA